MKRTFKLSTGVFGEGDPKICAPIVGRTKEDVFKAAEVIAKTEADVVEWRGDWFDRVEDRDELLRQITDQKFFEDACKVVQKHTDRIFEILSELNTSSSKRQARLAIDYIQTNYMDPDLSLNSICSYLNISTSYFSTIFKDETGETFTEVLIRTRMEKAKELLENTTLKNYEIAEKVGFSDPHYFGISFKKMTGCTPTEYAREKRR